MQDTPKASRLHIAIFGRRNAGKSSLINALTRQNIALVSDVPGTTTDPVYKAMEILPIGPVMIIDTAGIDDVGDLGALRVERTMQVLNKTDMAVLVIDVEQGVGEWEKTIVKAVKSRSIPVVAAVNKVDSGQLAAETLDKWQASLAVPMISVSAINGQGIEELKNLIIRHAPNNWENATILGDLINPGDTVVLVVPIDSAAPKGRLILPQVQTIRDILDHNGQAIVVKETELASVLANMKRQPRLVVTDSQAFKQVAAVTPNEVTLTSFSILFARYKGDLETLALGAKALADLKPGDKVLIAEGCTHHRQCDDIGTVKIPRLLRQKIGGDLNFEWVSGGNFPQNVEQYKLLIHCGACMLNRREMLFRLAQARGKNIPIINYGVLLAYLHGILPRALAPFPAVQSILMDKSK